MPLFPIPPPDIEGYMKEKKRQNVALQIETLTTEVRYLRQAVEELIELRKIKQNE